MRRPSWILCVLSAPLLIGLGPRLATAQVDDFDQQKLTASDAQAFADFGAAVAVSGSRLVVGAPGAADSKGAAYVFERQGGAWVEVQKLIASDGEADDGFGGAVDLGPGLVVVASPFDDSRGTDRGAVYVFEEVGGTWSQAQRLQSADGRRSENFGRSLSLDGDRLAIGAPFYDRRDGQFGRVYLFEKVGGRWEQTVGLTVGDSVSDRFGWDVALAGDRLLVGAPQPSFRGVAFLYELVGDFWVETPLSPADDSGGREFGWSVALEGNLAVVGDPEWNKGGGRLGLVTVFREEGGRWSDQALDEDQALSNGRFGTDVAVQGRTLAVGAEDHNFAGDPQFSGGIFSYGFDGDEWIPLRTMQVGDPHRVQRLGSRIALDAELLLAGVALDEAGGQDAGAAYTFVHGPLAFDVTPSDPRVGDSVALQASGGRAGGLVLLYVQQVDGQPFVRQLLAGRFRGDGQWLLSSAVPPGLSGIRLTLSTIGFVTADEFAESNLEVIELR